MNHLPLVQSGPGLDDWIDIILVLLIVGGSLFGAVAKKLIKYFNQRTPAGTETEIADDIAQPGAPSYPRQSVPPIVQPLPPRARRRSRAAPPVARPLPARPVAQPMTDLSACEHAQADAPPLPETLFPSETVDYPRAEQPPNLPSPSSIPRSASGSRRTTQPKPPSKATQPGRARPAKKVRTSEGKRVEAKFDHLDPEAHLGHVASRLPPATVGTKDRTGTGWLRGLSRNALRQAIVMNEILGLPRSLRGFDDPTDTL